jgi:hypothetical protein
VLAYGFGAGLIANGVFDTGIVTWIQFHIGVTYGISESHVCEIIKETESILIKNSCFHLPGKKSLLT